MIEQRFKLFLVGKHPFMPLEPAGYSFNDVKVEIGAEIALLLQSLDHMHHAFDLRMDFGITLSLGKGIVLEIGFIEAIVPAVGKDPLVILAVHEQPVHLIAVPEQQETTRYPVRSHADQIIFLHQVVRNEIPDIPVDDIDIPVPPKIITRYDVVENMSIGWFEIAKLVAIVDLHGKTKAFRSNSPDIFQASENKMHI